MTRLCIMAAALWIVLCAPQVRATSALDLHGYQEEDGAIATGFGGDVVDPYFATKALIEARRLGLDVNRASRAWIGWLIKRQLPDGRFERYCGGPAHGRPWLACSNADADDALLALWIQLLIETAPAGRMPPAWRASVERAARHLERLRQAQLGVFQISMSQPVALLMDNLEIHSALRTLAAARQNVAGAAGRTSRSALAPASLRSHILDVFWDRAGGRMRVSTQVTDGTAFYPDEVAQLFPWLEGFEVPGFDRELYRRWMQRNGNHWLDVRADHYPWGLVAVVARTMGDDARVACWLVKSAPFRYSARWNVLEEALFQALGEVNRTRGQVEPCSAVRD